MRRLRFDRNELAGSFGDIGTDVPLLMGMILSAGLDSASVLVVFGALQILTGLFYGLPMPMQPLKAMAVIVITQQVAAPVLYGAGFAIGAVMLLLCVTGLLDALARAIPKCVVRGIQFGLGLSLARLALGKYVAGDGIEGYALALFGFAVMAALWGNRRFPPGLLVIGAGVAYAAFFRLDAREVQDGVGLAWPAFHAPSLSDIVTGFLLLSLPQIPLSLSNSIIATRQTIADLFPERHVTIRKIGFTYAFVNLVAPFLGGIPACHGCGGLAGHYALGARTGGSVVLYGSYYLVLGLFLSRVAGEIISAFPQALLGVVLVFESLTLLGFVRDQTGSQRDLSIAFLVALAVFALPQGYVVGLVLGTALYYLGAFREKGAHEG
ncbi:MAG: hypothetical protein KatS3mg076_3204 [Candidatus Binatia bacterium]|nr:MAG: hypothetical protein KatS3mg076_3204 [Candidatus Binatia bacterium]